MRVQYTLTREKRKDRSDKKRKRASVTDRRGKRARRRRKKKWVQWRACAQHERRTVAERAHARLASAAATRGCESAAPMEARHQTRTPLLTYPRSFETALFVTRTAQSHKTTKSKQRSKTKSFHFFLPIPDYNLKTNLFS